MSQMTRGKEMKSQRIVRLDGVCAHFPFERDLYWGFRVERAFVGEDSGSE